MMTLRPYSRSMVKADCVNWEEAVMALTLERLRGRIGDLDSHEAIPIPRYPEVFGEIGRRFLDENQELWAAAKKISQFNPTEDITSDRTDNAQINRENVWTLKGAMAPGAIDMDRRIAGMDGRGIDRQLIFPMMGIFAWITANGGGQNWMPKSTTAQMQLGRLAIGAYNQWAGSATKNPAVCAWWACCGAAIRG